jgi:hypothetical protein
MSDSSYLWANLQNSAIDDPLFSDNDEPINEPVAIAKEVEPDCAELWCPVDKNTIKFDPVDNSEVAVRFARKDQNTTSQKYLSLFYNRVSLSSIKEKRKTGFSSILSLPVGIRYTATDRRRVTHTTMRSFTSARTGRLVVTTPPFSFSRRPLR